MEYDTYEERAVLRNIAEDVDSLVRRYALTEEEKKEGETKKGIKQKQLRSRDDDWIGTRFTDRGRDPPDVFTGSVEDVTGTTGTDGYPSIRHSGVQVDIPRDNPVEDLDTGVTDGGYGSNRAGTDHRILLIRGRIGRAQNVPVAGLTGVFDNVRVEVRLLRSSYRPDTGGRRRPGRSYGADGCDVGGDSARSFRCGRRRRPSLLHVTSAAPSHESPVWNSCFSRFLWGGEEPETEGFVAFDVRRDRNLSSGYISIGIYGRVEDEENEGKEEEEEEEDEEKWILVGQSEAFALSDLIEVGMEGWLALFQWDGKTPMDNAEIYVEVEVLSPFRLDVPTVPVSPIMGGNGAGHSRCYFSSRRSTRTSRKYL